jgi:hypothetical protein
VLSLNDAAANQTKEMLVALSSPAADAAHKCRELFSNSAWLALTLRYQMQGARIKYIPSDCFKHWSLELVSTAAMFSTAAKWQANK